MSYLLYMMNFSVSIKWIIAALLEYKNFNWSHLSVFISGSHFFAILYHLIYRKEIIVFRKNGYQKHLNKIRLFFINVIIRIIISEYKFLLRKMLQISICFICSEVQKIISSGNMPFFFMNNIIWWIKYNTIYKRFVGNPVSFNKYEKVSSILL